MFKSFVDGLMVNAPGQSKIKTLWCSFATSNDLSMAQEDPQQFSRPSADSAELQKNNRYVLPQVCGSRYVYNTGE